MERLRSRVIIGCLRVEQDVLARQPYFGVVSLVADLWLHRIGVGRIGQMTRWPRLRPPLADLRNDALGLRQRDVLCSCDRRRRIDLV